MSGVTGSFALWGTRPSMASRKLNRGQADAISLFQDSEVEASKVITDNLFDGATDPRIA